MLRNGCYETFFCMSCPLLVSVAVSCTLKESCLDNFLKSVSETDAAQNV